MERIQQYAINPDRVMHGTRSQTDLGMFSGTDRQEEQDWGKVSRKRNLAGLLYRAKMEAALTLVERCRKKPVTRVLEIGCGSGFLTANLTRRDFTIDAIDSVPAVVASASSRVANVKADSEPRLHLGDPSKLKFDDESFDLVIALHALPWIREPRVVFSEIIRVLKSGGFLLLSARNSRQIGTSFDPLLSPLTAPAREWVGRLLVKAGLKRPVFRPDLPMMHSYKTVHRLLEEWSLNFVDGRAIGFGPFTVFGIHVMPDMPGRAVHTRLQRMADAGVPFLKRAGSHYLVLSSKADKKRTGA